MLQNVNDDEFLSAPFSFISYANNNKNWVKAFLSPKNNYVSTGFVVQLTALLCRSPTFLLVL